MSPEEPPSGLLTVNGPGLYPEVLHVKGHSGEDGLATREQLQVSHNCTACHFLAYFRHKGDVVASFLQLKLGLRGNGVVEKAAGILNMSHLQKERSSSRCRGDSKDRTRPEEKLRRKGGGAFDYAHTSSQFLRSLVSSNRR